MKKLPLSLVVIVKNEEKNIERCLRSVPFASEILVVDSDSTDGTVAKAQSLGARTLVKEWLGFGAQKNYASMQAQNDWILSLDADEALSPESQEEIQKIFADLNPEVAYRIPRKSFHLGRWIHHGGWYPDYQTRLYHRKHSSWAEVNIHEKIMAKSTKKLQKPILHWVFKDLSHQVQTNDKYSGLLAEKLNHEGKKFSLFKLITKPWVKFIECYFWKLGFLDGRPGFIIAVSAAYSVFLKWSKLGELQRKESSK